MKDIEEPYPGIHSWNFLHIEGYCTLNLEYGSKYSDTCYQFKKDEDGKFEFIPVPNEQYDPLIKPDPYPENCCRHITCDCIKCPHFAYAESDYEWHSDWDNEDQCDDL